MANENPLVSVIIPMYNVEKYIGELLESLMAQTFKNFEIIAVDNCSTDNSAKFFENYLKNRGGGQLLRNFKNSGNASFSRNRGLEFSRGKYVFFMDSDDVLTKTALEEMYVFAEHFQADVVQCERRYTSKGVGEELIKNAKLSGDLFTDKPAFVNDNLAEKVNLFFSGVVPSPPWLKLVRRDFLVKNDLKFKQIFREDDLWSFEIFLYAKKYMLIPNACVLHRMRDDAMTFPKDRPLNKHLHYWLDRTINGINFLNDFMDRLEFFKKNPQYRYFVLNRWLSNDLQIVLDSCKHLQPHEVYEIFKTEFEKDLGANDVLVSALIANSFTLLKNLIIAQQKINLLEKK